MNFLEHLFFAVTAVLLPLLLCCAIASTIIKFVGEVKVELDKCSWPWDPNQTGFKKYKELRRFDRRGHHLRRSCWPALSPRRDWLLTHLVGFLTGTALLK